MSVQSQSRQDWKNKSSSSSNSEEVTDRDMQKVQTLWNDIQQAKTKNASQSFNYRNSASQNVSQYAEEAQDYREKLRLSERQLNEARDTIIILSKRLAEAEDENKGHRDYINKAHTLTSLKTNQINRMTTQYNNMNLSQKEIIERSRESNIALIHDLEEKNREIERLKGLSKTGIDKLSVVSISHGQASAQMERLQDEIESYKHETERLRRDLQDARQNILDLQQIKKSEGMAMLEIEHLRGDVHRLVKMLRTTQEYSDFADFADDHTGSVRFLKNTLRETAVDHSYNRMASSAGFGRSGADARGTSAVGSKRYCKQEATTHEHDMWYPRDAFKFAQEFRRKYNGEFTDELLEKLLFELNRIWSRRENQRVQRVQNKSAHEVMKLKRKMTQSEKFNEVQAKDRINKLQSDLKDAYRDNRKAHAERTSMNPPGIHYVNETMRMAKDAHKFKKTLGHENDYLRSQIKDFHTTKHHLGF